jgi:hypothetical protein
MKMMRNKNIYLFLRIVAVIIIFCSFLSVNQVFAATKWLYWSGTSDTEVGPFPNAGYDTKAACETDRSRAESLGHTVSASCYAADPVKVTSFILDQGATGKPGEWITITGQNLITGKSGGVLIGSIAVSNIAPQKDTNYTKLRVEIPDGVTTGKITVTTQYHGSAISATNFTVAASSGPDNRVWAYLNAEKQYTGGWATKPECEVHLAEAVAGGLDGTGRNCTLHTPEEIKKSQELHENPTEITPVNQSIKDDYTLLAPIGGVTTIKTTNIGDYFNKIFLIAIGLCGALAVIMIVIAGIQYMGTESVFGKTEAKSKIFSAILGLLIAIGAWIILNTIDPALTGVNGLTVDQTEANIIPTSGGGYFGVDVGTPKAGNPNATKNVTTYDAYLKAASQKYGVQCTLIKAFMYAESGGVNGLTSPVGAKGLIQLMPATFTEQGYDVSKAMDPATNIMAGASYLSKLKQSGCNGKSSSAVCNISNIQFLAASYNGGPRANKESSTCKGQTAWQCTQNSGYAETRIYAPRVEANFNKLSTKGWGC